MKVSGGARHYLFHKVFLMLGTTSKMFKVHTSLQNLTESSLTHRFLHFDCFFGVSWVTCHSDIVFSEFKTNENSPHGFVAERYMTSHFISLFRADITDTLRWILDFAAKYKRKASELFNL